MAQRRRTATRPRPSKMARASANANGSGEAWESLTLGQLMREVALDYGNAFDAPHVFVRRAGPQYALTQALVLRLCNPFHTVYSAWLERLDIVPRATRGGAHVCPLLLLEFDLPTHQPVHPAVVQRFLTAHDALRLRVALLQTRSELRPPLCMDAWPPGFQRQVRALPPEEVTWLYHDEPQQAVAASSAAAASATPEDLRWDPERADYVPSASAASAAPAVRRRWDFVLGAHLYCPEDAVLDAAERHARFECYTPAQQHAFFFWLRVCAFLYLAHECRAEPEFYTGLYHLFVGVCAALCEQPAVMAPLRLAAHAPRLAPWLKRYADGWDALEQVFKPHARVLCEHVHRRLLQWPPQHAPREYANFAQFLTDCGALCHWLTQQHPPGAAGRSVVDNDACWALVRAEPLTQAEAAVRCLKACHRLGVHHVLAEPGAGAAAFGREPPLEHWLLPDTLPHLVHAALTALGVERETLALVQGAALFHEPTQTFQTLVTAPRALFAFWRAASALAVGAEPEAAWAPQGWAHGSALVAAVSALFDAPALLPDSVRALRWLVGRALGGASYTRSTAPARELQRPEAPDLCVRLGFLLGALLCDTEAAAAPPVTVVGHAPHSAAAASAQPLPHDRLDLAAHLAHVMCHDGAVLLWRLPQEHLFLLLNDVLSLTPDTGALWPTGDRALAQMRTSRPLPLQWAPDASRAFVWRLTLKPYLLRARWLPNLRFVSALRAPLVPQRFPLHTTGLLGVPWARSAPVRARCVCPPGAPCSCVAGAEADLQAVEAHSRALTVAPALVEVFGPGLLYAPPAGKGRAAAADVVVAGLLAVLAHVESYTRPLAPGASALTAQAARTLWRQRAQLPLAADLQAPPQALYPAHALVTLWSHRNSPALSDWAEHLAAQPDPLSAEHCRLVSVSAPPPPEVDHDRDEVDREADAHFQATWGSMAPPVYM